MAIISPPNLQEFVKQSEEELSIQQIVRSTRSDATGARASNQA
jgi:hypothetical protein